MDDLREETALSFKVVRVNGCNVNGFIPKL